MGRMVIMQNASRDRRTGAITACNGSPVVLDIPIQNRHIFQPCRFGLTSAEPDTPMWRSRLAAAVGLLLVLAAPSQLPAVAADGVLGSVLIAANPVSAGLKLAGLVLIDQKPLSSQLHLLISPVVAAIVLTVLAVRLSRRIRLGGAR